ncbi:MULTISPECIES: DUF4230 domain-containing protein [unclassified Geodermatophilus]
MPTTLLHRDPDASSSHRPVRRRSRAPRRLVALGVAAGVAVPVGLVVADRVADWTAPFEQEVVDRSTPPLLLALEDLAEYRAATGTFQVVIDQERDTAWVPSVISGERVQFLATGSVDASVDFSGIGEGDVELSADGESATITLPAPELGQARVDPEQSRVLDRDRGLVERLGDALADDPTDESALFALAEDRLESAAAESDLGERAEANTRDMLTTLAGSLGVDSVTVTFEPAPSATG